MKEKIKIPEKELNEMDISNLLDAEFKTLVIRMFRKLVRTTTASKSPSHNEGYTN